MTLSVSIANTSNFNSVLIRYGGGVSQFFPAKCNGDDIFLTAAITFQSETNKEDIDLAASGERVDGIVVSEIWPITVDLDKDSDDCFDNDTWVRCYRPIARDLLWATTATNTSITKDDWVKYVDDFYKEQPIRMMPLVVWLMVGQLLQQQVLQNSLQPLNGGLIKLCRHHMVQCQRNLLIGLIVQSIQLVGSKLSSSIGSWVFQGLNN